MPRSWRARRSAATSICGPASCCRSSTTCKAGGDGGLIVVGTKDRPAVKALLADAKLKAAVDGLGGRAVPAQDASARRPAGAAGRRRRCDRHALRRVSLGRAPGRAVLPARRRGARQADRPGTAHAGRNAQAAVRPPRHPAVPRFPRGARLVEPRRLQGDPRPVAEDGDELLRAAHLSREAASGRSRWCGSARPARSRPTAR